MLPDTIFIFGAFDTRDFFAPASTAIATISGDATSARVTLQTGTVLVYSGAGLTFGNGVPTGGTVTEVSVLKADGTPLATLTLAQTLWNFADIITGIPYQTYLATEQEIVDTLDRTLARTASTILGGNQNDFIISTGGADTVRGLDGDDFIAFEERFYPTDGAPSGLIVDGGAGSDTLYVRGPDVFTDRSLDLRQATMLSIESVFLLGGSVRISAAQIGGTGIATDAEIILFSGTQLVIDQIAGRTLDLTQFRKSGDPLQFRPDSTIRLIGTEVADRQIGSALFNDVLEGNGGSDRLSGRGGLDTLFGGEGNDTLFAGDDAGFYNGRDELFGGNGNDRLVAGSGTAILFGGAGNDRMLAGTGGALLLGDEGDDWLSTGNTPAVFGGSVDFSALFGGVGNDTLSANSGGWGLSGDEGDDLYIIRDERVFLLEAAGGGNDTIRTSVSLNLSSGEFTGDTGEFETIRVIGQAGLSVTGTATDNLIVGNIGADTLSGGDGADRVQGGRGADVLSGGTGADRLIGGADADRFVFATGFGADVVADFRADSDVIDLTGLANVTSFAALIADFIRQEGRNVVIDVGAGDVLTLANVRLAALDAADFMFA